MLVKGLLEQLAHLGIRCLREVFVPGANRVKRLGGVSADHIVNVLPEFLTRGAGGNGYRHDDAPGLPLPYSAGGRKHRCSGRQPIIHQDQRAPLNRQGFTSFAVEALAAFDLFALTRCYLLDYVGRNSQLRNEGVIQDAGAAAGNSPHRELFVARCSDLSDQEYIEIRVQRSREFVRDRNAASRQRQHKGNCIEEYPS
jgi:hypothetical protein